MDGDEKSDGHDQEYVKHTELPVLQRVLGIQKEAGFYR